MSTAIWSKKLRGSCAKLVKKFNFVSVTRSILYPEEQRGEGAIEQLDGNVDCTGGEFMLSALQADKLVHYNRKGWLNFICRL